MEILDIFGWIIIGVLLKMLHEQFILLIKEAKEYFNALH